MTKTQIKKLLAPNLLLINTANGDIATNKWLRAKAIYETYNMINWPNTPYKSFRRFVELELKQIHWASAWIWKADYARLLKYKYSWKEIETISKQVSYRRAVMQLKLLKIRVSVKTFIARAVKLTNLSTPHTTLSDPNRISLILSDAHLAKLESLLIPHGFIRTARLRMNFSSAMGKYLDTV